MPARHRPRTIKPSPQFDPAEVAALRSMRESFRKSETEEIRRVTSAIRNLCSIDSTRYRQEVTAARVEEKAGEAIVEKFQTLEVDSTLRSERRELGDKVEGRRDAWRRAAQALRRAAPDRAALDEKKARDYETILESLPPLRQIHAPAHIDSLTLDLVAIYWHTTDLSRQHVLKEIVPRILSVAWSCYPRSAPRRGAGAPFARFKRLRCRPDGLASDDYLYHRRCLLFAGDGRFVQALFEPHRTIRTVQPSH